MRYGNVPGVDKPVSRLVHGATAVPQFDEAGITKAFDAAFELGYTAIDSAAIYYGGQHERALGKWIKANGVREKVVILAKGAHHNSDRRRVTPFDITADLHDTQARLKVDYVDLLVMHLDDPNVPAGPIVEIMNEHIRAGKIKAYGGSNWSHQRVHEANTYAKERGLAPFALSNPQLSLATMVHEPWDNCVSISGPACDEAREWYRREGLAVFAWSSIAGGFLSGSLTRSNVKEYEEKFGTLTLKSYGSEENFQRLDRAFELAEAKDATVAQIALAWVLCQPLNIFALVGAANRDECRANAQALDIELTKEEMDYLDLRR